jgi:hypothetical protein
MAYIDSVAIVLRPERQEVELKACLNEGGSVIEISVGSTKLRLSKGQALMLALRLIEGVLEADRVEWLGWRP